MFGKVRPGWWGGHGATGRVTLAGILIAGVVAVGFGTGYTTTRAVATDDSAWLQKGDTIVQVNGPSGRYDAVVADRPVALAASVRDHLEIVETPGGQVYAADPSTHRVYMIELSTMAPQTLGASGSNVLAAAGSLFVVNAASGTVTSLDPKTLNVVASSKVPGGVASEAISPSGVAYIGSNDGRVTVLDHGKVTTTQVGPTGHPIKVSVVGNEPIAVDATNGQLYDVAGNRTSKQTIALPGQAGATVQLAPSLSGDTAWLIRGTQLVEVNPGTGYSVQATLPARDTFGAPLANAGSGYVPDDTANQVLVYDPAMGLAHRIPVPSGLPGNSDIQMVVKDGNVWANNPTSSEATVIHPNGTTQVVYKGTGNGVVVPGQARTPARVRTAPAGAPPSPTSRQTGASAPAPARPPASQTPPVTAPSLGPVSPAGPPTAAAAAVPVPARPNPPAVAPTARSPSTGPPGGSTAAMTVVPRGLEGKSVDTACQAIVAAQLTCATKDLGQAPPGQAPNQVTAVPQEGQSVPVHTSVEVDFHGSGAPVTVPHFSSGESPQTYCSQMPAGLTCTPNDLKQGNPADQVVSTTPAPGQSVPYGTTVLANFYSTSAPILVPTPGQNGAPADPQGYCAFADAVGFRCTAQVGTNGDTGGVAGLGDPGQPINQVVATDPPLSPAAGQPYGSTLTATYFTEAGVRVPSVDNLPTYSQACSTLTASQLTCGPGSNQVAPAGVAPGVIANTEQPAAGTVVAAGSTVNFSYYGEVAVPSCLGQAASSQCPATPGMSWGAPQDLGQFTTISCNLITGQSVAAGTAVPPGTTVTPQYNACPASAGISEWHLTNANMGKVHYLEEGTAVPGGVLAPGTWAGGASAFGSGYAPVGGACPAGTVPLVGSVLPTTNPAGFYHYAFTLNTGFSANGWSPALGAIACVFAPTAGGCPAGTVGVYSYTIDNVDWSWTENPGGNGLQWCELPG